jgi:hypothetical protein
VQGPPSSVVQRGVRWWREARQTQTQQLMKEPLPLPCACACSDDLAWHGYEECDDCCEDRVERTCWRFNEPLMLACCQHLCEVGNPGEDEEVGFYSCVIRGGFICQLLVKYMMLCFAVFGCLFNCHLVRVFVCAASMSTANEQKW